MGKLVEIKTKQTEASVDGYLDAIPDERKRNDSRVIMNMMKKATKEEPKLWGSSIIGFGNVRYESPATGRQVDWFRIGFAPRKANLTLYFGANIQKQAELFSILGKHKTGGGCVYINKLDDIDLKVLEKIVVAAAKSKGMQET